MKIYEIAEKIAREGHKTQTRWDKVTPYITHCEAVVENTRKILKDFKYDSNLLFVNACIATAWDHDLFEDHPETFPIEKIEQLLSEYNPDVFGNIELTTTITAIKAITKNPDKEAESYLEYLTRVKNNAVARLVKLADLEHNLSDLKKGNHRDKYLLAQYFLLN